MGPLNPIDRQLIHRDEIYLRVPLLVDNTLSRHPEALVEPGMPDSLESLELSEILNALWSPFLGVGME